jgi:hypothetical protein
VLHRTAHIFPTQSLLICAGGGQHGKYENVHKNFLVF